MLYLLLQWGASPLEDNLPTDDYHYQLSVTTGMKKNGGTASNISFIISGETCDTGVRRLFDGKRKVCVNNIRASIGHFGTYHLSHGPHARKPVFGGLQTTQAQTSLRICAV